MNIFLFFFEVTGYFMKVLMKKFSNLNSPLNSLLLSFVRTHLSASNTSVFFILRGSKQIFLIEVPKDKRY